MNLIWIASPSDNEFDLSLAISKNPDINCTFYILTDPLDKNHTYHMSQLTKAPNIIINEIQGDQVDNVLQHLTTISKDLIVLRHPTWISSNDRAKELAEILKDQPYVVTTWEWVPNYAMAQMPPLGPWKRIATTNYQDFNRAKLSYPDKQILYLPFGVVKRTPEELTPKPEYYGDLVCDAQPHYDCKEYNAAKRYSVDQIIKPALELDYILNLWGSRYGESTICDWGHTPEFQKYHRGSFPTMEYPHVYKSAKIYLGVTWNYGTGGFSVRLARALSCGMAVIWQQTAGAELDIPNNFPCKPCKNDVKVLEWSKNYEHTKELIKFYMEHEMERKFLGEHAIDWALENWEWGMLVKKLVKEIQ